MKTNLLQQSVQARLGYCALAAAGAAVAPVPQAEASIITFTPNLTLPATTAGVYINFLTGATGTSAASVSGWDLNPYLASGGTRLGFYWNPSPASSNGGVATAGQYTDLSIGTTISGASTFINTIAATNNFLTAGQHVLGFRFFNESTSTINFGYAVFNMTAGATNGFPATLVSYSFENTGGAITYTPAAVPEPGTAVTGLLALALGAGAVRNWRRRQTAA
ncbi:MAG: hypothetical protein JSR82_18635 [Verrucomicrobia bacterium]|nr:hypothetical protein [Verrucomicrobiota bacterium]